MNLNKYLNKAEELDREDALYCFKEQFYQNDDHMIYLDGNSLGKMPLKSVELLETVVKEQWGNRLIRSWNENWMKLPVRITKKLAHLLGAHQDEIAVGDSTSTNLYKLAFSVLKYQTGRTKIVTDSMNFPTDLYILQGLVEQQFKDHTIKIVNSRDGISSSTNEIIEALDKDTALLTLSHVTYKSSYLYDMERINKEAKEKGVLVIWDLSHSAGAVPVKLNAWETDMAVGCTYKFLNGGPGAPAYLFVSRHLLDSVVSPVWGWFGHQKPFDFDSKYIPSSTAGKFSAGTPHILSMIPVEAGLDIFLEAGIDAIRAKSVKMTEFLIGMVNDVLNEMGYSLGSPGNILERGSHVSMIHPEGYRISQALISPCGDAPVIIPDFRPPNNIRIGITPLYTSFSDLVETVKRMGNIVTAQEYMHFSETTNGVT